MKKLKLLAAAGGAVALVAIWPLAVGQIGQTIVTDGVKNIHNQDVTVSLEEYHRGYLTSEAKTLVTVTDPQALAQLNTLGLPTEYEFVHVIHHGIVSLNSDSYYAQNPELKLNTKTQLNGNTEFSTDIAKQQFKFEGSEPFTAVLNSLSISGSITVLGQLDYTMNMPSLEIDYQNGAVVHFDGLSSNGNGKFEQDFWMGQQKLALDGFVVNDHDGNNVFELSGLTYQFETTQDEAAQTLQADYALALKEFKNHDGEAANLDLKFTAGGLDKTAFLALTQMYQNSPVWTEQDTAKAIPNINALLEKGFSVSLNHFSVDVDEGHFKSDWHMSLPSAKDNAIDNPMHLVDVMQGDMNAFVSSDLVMAYPFIQQNLDELLIMEVAKQTDDGYSMSLQMQDGKIKFANGKEMPLISLLMPMMMPKAH
ncbi:YdgA family protein [Vibrio rarus]|uniref:YdgA family protein n=1 Tax=Vibrio rarus TaxID=413403 RepID=UPI0021C39F29|nr:YdgA family protein [Vibrio rarus]